MQSRTLVVLVALVAVVGVTGASAFTTATVARDAQINVENDANGIVGLDGNENVAGISDGDTLSLNLDESAALNNEATFTFGNSSNPTTTEAFVLQNNASEPADLTLSYSVNGTDSSTTDNVEFAVYDSSGDQAQTFAEGGSTSLTGVASDEKYFVVITIDTTGLASTDDLSGTLTVDASAS